jgi:hypothetical protein
VTDHPGPYMADNIAIWFAKGGSHHVYYMWYVLNCRLSRPHVLFNHAKREHTEGIRYAAKVQPKPRILNGYFKVRTCVVDPSARAQLLDTAGTVETTLSTGQHRVSPTATATAATSTRTRFPTSPSGRTSRPSTRRWPPWRRTLYCRTARPAAPPLQSCPARQSPRPGNRSV